MAATPQTPKCHHNRGAAEVVVTFGSLWCRSHDRKRGINFYSIMYTVKKENEMLLYCHFSAVFTADKMPHFALFPSCDFCCLVTQAELFTSCCHGGAIVRPIVTSHIPLLQHCDVTHEDECNYLNPN